MRHNKPNIVCLGILDTKADEIRFLAQELRKKSANVKIMDISLGAEAQWADIPLSEVLAADEVKTKDVFKVPRSQAIDIVGKAGAKKMVQLFEAGAVDGVIAWAGSAGTSVASRIMRSLPIGFPKMLMCTLASGDVSGWLGNKDIYIVNPIGEMGINRVTREIVSKAAAAMVAMASEPNSVDSDARPLVALTAYGTTTPTVIRCAKFMEERGWDSIIIHQVGTGATMEDLIRSKQITAVYDITPGELSNTMYGSIYAVDPGWEGQRLTAASDRGIPQIVCPGGLAQCAYGPLKTLPEQYLKEYATGERKSYKNSGTPYCHNEAVTVLTPSLSDTRTLALEIITKLNNTKGPTALIIPMRGWSAYDQPAEVATIERGWAKEQGDGPVWMPDPHNPRWSQRATTMCAVFEEHIDRRNGNLDFIQCDMHLLDDAFVEILNQCMEDMIENKWRKGLYQDRQGVLPDSTQERE